MATCSPDPRTIDEGLDWFLSVNPSGPGMCAQHTRNSLGGDRGCPPMWDCPNANAVYDKVIASGRYWTTPRRGDIIVWKYGNNGHAARVYNDAGTQIATTDPGNGKPTGVEDIDYPAKWGATPSKRICTDTYNGVKCFNSGEAASVSHGAVYLSKLHYGQENSDSVKRLQMHLNDHPLQGGESLELAGNYLDQTDEEVRLCQAQHGYGSDAAKESSVGPKQAAHLIAGCDCEVIDDLGNPEPPVTAPPPGGTVTTDVGIWDWYSEKFDSKVLVHPGSWKDIDLPAQPASGIKGKSKEEHFLYLRIHLPKGRSATRTIHTQFIRSDGDATAMLSLSYDSSSGNDSIAYPNFHIEKGSGLGGKWQIMVEGGTDPIDYTTRYAKTYVTYREEG